MAEDFGVQGRGAFYDETGAVRDVVQNHLFQLLSNLAMEPPARTDSESLRDEKVKVLKSIPALEAGDIVRGQFRGYRQEPGVARRFAGRDVCGCPAPHRVVAMAGRPVLYPRREVPPLDGHRDRRPPAAASNRVPVSERPSLAELLPLSNHAQVDHRVRPHGDGRGRIR